MAVVTDIIENEQRKESSGAEKEQRKRMELGPPIRREGDRQGGIECCHELATSSCGVVGPGA